MRAFGVLSTMALLAASLAAAVGTPAPAGATGTVVIAETFHNTNVTSPGSWVKPPGPSSSHNLACLTAGTATTQTPIPDCSNPEIDADNSGVLQLTDPGQGEEGGALTSLSVPASNGLDATFYTYQYGGSAADGIGFVIAAEDPSNPVAPTQIGQPGGDLGYSDAGASGLADGYLGVGLDVYGNYSSTAGFEGSGCTDPSWAGANSGQVVVRGPGDGGTGYCLLDSSAHVFGGKQVLHGSDRSGSLVPVEVVLNTTPSTVNMSGSHFASTSPTESVPSGDYGVAWVPIDGSPEFYTGALPKLTDGSLYPAGYINPATGFPYQLGFGWVGSTGDSTDYHQVSDVSVSTLQPVPVLSAAISDSGNGQLPSGSSVSYTLQAGVTSGGAENDAITMTATLPSQMTPGSATGTNWTCPAPMGQVVTCTYDGPLPIAAGTTLPSVSLPAAVEGGLATGTSLDSSLKVSSDDGNPATASDHATAVATPASLSSVTLSATATADPTSTTTPAGIGTVLLDNNGSLPTVTQQNASGSTSGSPNAAVASTKINGIKINGIKINGIKINGIKINGIGLSGIASQAADIKSLQNDLLSNIGVTYPDGCTGSTCTDWKGILEGSQYAGLPLQSVNLQEVLTTTGSDSPDGSNPAARLNALPLSDFNIGGSTLGSLPVAAYALGGTSIDNVPLNSADVGHPDLTLADWCTALSGVHWPCSDFGITSNTDTTDANNVTVLALGIAGVPLASIGLDTIPLQSSTVDTSPVAGLSLAGTSLNDTGLGGIKINGIGVGAIKINGIGLGTSKINGIKMNGVPLGNTSLEDIKMNGVALGSLELGDIPLQGTKINGIKINGIPLDQLALGTVKINGIKMNGVALGGMLLSSISNLSSIVECSLMPSHSCTTPAGQTLADAQAAGAILPGANLQTLQAGVTEPNAAWDATVLGDVDGSDSSDPGADTTTIADLVTLAQNDPAFAQVFSVAVLSDVSSSDATDTLAQIEGALVDPSADTTTLAELLSAELGDTGTTIGQLIDQIATDDPSAFNGLFLGDLLSGLVPESSFPWQNVDLTTPGLAAASTGGGEVTLTATTTVANGPVALTELFTLPAGFSLVPGSALFDGSPSPDPTVSGNTLLANPGNATGNDTYTVEVRPNEVLGDQSLSVAASIATGGSQSAGASVNITDPFAGNGSPLSASTLQPDSLNVSFITAPNTSAYWDINVPAGDALSLDLSDLPADYDMVLYGPPTTQLSGTPQQTTAGVTDTPPADQSSTGQQSAPAPGDLPLLSNLPVQAISSSRGLTPEQITTPSLSGGTYLVQITGFNGAYSTTAPYALRSQLITTAASPSCAAPNTYKNDALTQGVVPSSGQPLVETWSASGGNGTGVWSLQPAPTGVNTLFLVNPDRLYDAYGQSSSGGQPGVNDVLQQLTTTINSGAGGMVGAIVPVEGDAQTAADYTAWDASPCSVPAANKVVSDISATVRSLEATYPTVSNIVVVGADDQIPMARVPDTTVSDNESDYAASTLPGIYDQLSSALSEGYFFSDDPYASPNPLGVGGQTLYTPSLAIGRLVETPTQIDNALARYQSSNGRLNATSGLSTGYNFLTQGANAIAASLSGPLGANAVTKLISESWTKSDLLNAIDGGSSTNPATAPDIASINAHFDFSRALSAFGNQGATQNNSEILNTSDVRNADPNNEISQERLLFSLGCHSGLQIPTNEISNVVPGGLDSWASTFADEGAIWVGNTGYGYANDQYISYSAKLMGLVAQSLDGSVSIGDALSQAKQLYAAQTGVLDPYDLKADMESTYYGMPNYTLTGLAHPSANSAAATPQLTLGHDPATGLQTAAISLSQSTGSNPNQLGTVNPPEGGTYYEVNNSTLEQTTAGFPIEPLSSIDVTLPGANGALGSVAHGALITGLTSTDVGNFTPSIAEASSDTSGPENQISQYETSFPATLQRVATYQLFGATGAPVTHQAVDLITGQFVPDPDNPGTGNQRLFTNLTSNVEYTSPSDTNFTPPTINEATGIVVNNSSANFNVVATPAPGGSPVKEVLVLFTDSANPGTWTPVNLSLGASGAWTGGAPAPASGMISYIIQAVDGDGNVAMNSNKGVEFNQVQASQVQSTGLGAGLSATPTPENSSVTETNGFFNGPVDLTFTGDPSATVTYQVDGGGSNTVTLGLTGHGLIIVLGDGTHVITASDTGNQISQAVQIDSTGPTISSSISAPNAGNGWTSGGTLLHLSASDTGSGVASLTYQAPGGQPMAVTGPITPPSGQTSYTVTATDFVGNTSSTIVTTQVDTTAPSVTCTGPDTNWHATDQSATCTGTDTQSGIAGGTSSTGTVTLTTSVPPGTSTANASTASGQICDNVTNCTPIPPISGFMIDEAAPVIHCPTADSNWHSGTVTFTCTASDSGSGLGNPAQSSFTLSASITAGTTNANASTNSVQVCDNVGNCATAGPITGVKIDNAAPAITCPTADTNWHTGTVTFTCTASDPVSGLAIPAQSSLTLSASITAGTTNANASTNSVQVCDNVGNCATAGPITGVKIDNAAPAISCPSADSNWHTGTVTFTCAASDSGSGLGIPAQSSFALSASITAGTTNANASTNSVQVCDNVGNCATAGPITGVKIDNAAPTVTCPSAGSNWHLGTVTYTCTASDSGSGLGNPAQSSFTLSASITAGTTNANASTNSVQVCDNVGECATAGPITGVKIDNAAPKVTCPSADSNWHTGTVTFTCTASDSASGLANPAQSSITLSASIAAGTSNANASTNTVQVCDNVGNCATAGPITGVKIDNIAPGISITNPTNGAVYTLNQPESASFSCSDAIFGIASCKAVSGTTTISSGSTLPTNQVGSHTIKVTATSNSGQVTTVTYTYLVTYKICNFVGPIGPFGTIVLFTVTLCNYTGTNVGSSSIAVTALNVDGTTAPKPVLKNTFLFVGAKVYAYAMLSTGLAKGSHVLNVSVAGDPVTHALNFTLK